MRGVTLTKPTTRVWQVFLLTRLMRGVTNDLNDLNKDFIISTHTPHARRDGKRYKNARTRKDFYSHASCEA